MTVSTPYAPLTYAGDSAQTSFPVSFPFLTGSLVVTLINDASGVETLQSIPTHYTVSGGSDGYGLPGTGAIIMAAAPATGVTLRIERATPRTQATTWATNTPFPEKVVEASFDKQVLLLQEALYTAEYQVLLDAGAGDIVGPSVSAVNELPLFSDTSGNLLKRSGVLLFTPEAYGAVGDNTADDSAAITAWIAALKTESSASGTAYGLLSGKYKITSQQTLSGWSGAIDIAGVGGDAGFYLSGSSNFTGLYIEGGTGSVVTSTTVTTNAAVGATSIIVSSSTGLAVGDFIQIENGTGIGGEYRGMLNRIKSVVSTTIGLEVPLTFAINVANSATVKEYTFRSGISMRNVVFDGAAATGTVVGLGAFSLNKAVFHDVSARNISLASSTGLTFYNIYDSSFSNITVDRCGYQATSDAIGFGYMTRCTLSGVRSAAATGFGIGINTCAASQFTGLIANSSYGRNIKLFGTCGCNFSNVDASLGGSTYVGLALNSGSSHNNFTNVTANSTTGASSAGVWLNGAGNQSNTFTNVTARGNGTFDVTSSTTGGLTDTGNVFIGVNADAVVSLYSDNLMLRASGAALVPGANDGAALGASGTAWSDLFLASGAVVNFNAGDVTITHSADLLALAGGRMTFTFGGAADTPAVLATHGGSSIKWTHGNTNYIGSMGALDGSGTPFWSMHAEHSTTTNTLKNSGAGVKGMYAQYDGTDIRFIFNGTATASANFSSAVTGLIMDTAGALTISGALTVNSATLIKSNTTLTNGAAAQTGTLTNAPAAGNPTKWIPINDNGTTRYIPAW